MNLKLVLAEAEQAEAAGFTAAAEKLRTTAERARKMAIAYEHYRIVTEEIVQAFNKKLKEKTSRPATEADARKLANQTAHYHATIISDQLTFQAVEKYPGLPPADVLGKLSEAKARQCFDSYEVAEINPVATQIKLPDPLLFGRIEGCPDRFFIAEWGTDVSITDLLKKNEG